MRSYTLIVWLLLLPALLIAQAADAFDDHPDTFIRQFDELLRQTSAKQQLDRANAVMPSLSQFWKEGRFTGPEQQAVIATANLMRAERMRPYPHFILYAEALLVFAKQSPSNHGFVIWNNHVNQLVKSKSTSEFESVLQTSIGLFASGRMAGRGSTNWFVRNAVFRFEANDGLEIHIQSGGLVCATSRDSSHIRQTQGVFVMSSQKWLGKGGSISWSRFGQDFEKVYAELSNYEIDMNRPSFSADSVVFRNPDFFPFPVLGSLQEQVYSSPPSDRTPHPRFRSYLADYEIDNFFPSLGFKGGIMMEGKNVIGVSANGQDARLMFFKDRKLMASMRSGSFTLSQSRLQSTKVEATFYLDGDSLHHPSVWFRYDNPTRMLTLSRSEAGIGDSPFYNSYHQLDMFVEAVYWNIDDDWVNFRVLDGLATVSNARVESSDFFSEAEFRRLQGMDDMHPAHMIQRYVNQMNSGNLVNIRFLADYIKKPYEQVTAQLLRLAALGYLMLDEEAGTVNLLDRFWKVLDARANKADFDVIRINSSTPARQPNLTLNLKSFDLQMFGVNEVVLSEVQSVQLFPQSNTITFKKNRDFTFTGNVKAGLFNFYAREASFEYSPFRLNFSFVDSLSFIVKRRDQPANVPNPQYVKVENVIADLTGTLYIDDAGNKSGKKDNPRFPIFKSTSESYVYFDKPNVHSGTLQRDRFYYVVDPFEIDSLDNFSTDNLRFSGYLTSAGIFPVFREPLGVMNNYSLGFEHNVPAGGYPVHGGLAQYHTTIKLSNQGFRGLGQLDYITAKAWSKDFFFYPDSVKAGLDKFTMEERTVAVEYPIAHGADLQLSWTLQPNEFHLVTAKEPLTLMSNVKLDGQLNLSPLGSKGGGRLAFDQVRISSDYYNFLSRAFSADTADFSLLTADGKKEAFLAQDYNTTIDFRNRTGGFTNISANSKLSFPFNLYYCTLDEAVWFMDQNRIALNNNKVEKKYNLESIGFNDLIDLNLSGSEFVSEHPAQDSLSFFCLQADYDLNEYAILARNVKIIRVADAAIFPNDGLVTILKDAVMKPLESTTIITSLSNKYHYLTDAKVDIKGKKSFAASGNYTYMNLNNESYLLSMSSIGVNKQGQTVGKAIVKAEDDFKLNPWFAFSGEVLLNSNERYLRFNGGYRALHQCFSENMPWVAFDTIIDPVNVSLPVKDGATAMAGGKVNSGLFYSAATDGYYAAFLQQPRGADKQIAGINGMLSYDRQRSEFRIEETAAATGRSFLVLNTNRCIVQGRSALDLDLRLPSVTISSAGSFEHRLIPDSLYLNVFLSLQFPFDEKLMSQMADSINAANLPGIALNQGNYLYAFAKNGPAVDVERVSNEIALYGAPRRVPEAYTKQWVISDLQLIWNSATRSFISSGPLSIANINRNQVNKNVEGFVEIEKARSGDAFSIYLMLNTKQWYFFNYQRGIMQAMSSSNQFNTDLMNIKQDKRVFSDPATGGRYEYIIATRRRMVDFLRKMQEVQR